jgi:hypothetical protein
MPNFYHMPAWYRKQMLEGHSLFLWKTLKFEPLYICKTVLQINTRLCTLESIIMSSGKDLDIRNQFDVDTPKQRCNHGTRGSALHCVLGSSCQVEEMAIFSTSQNKKPLTDQSKTCTIDYVGGTNK